MSDKESLIKAWTKEPFSIETRTEAERILQEFKDGKNSPEIEAYTVPLEFGTGGMRGVIGSGIGRMNEFTVGRAALGFCLNLTKKFKGKKISISIAYDSRRKSKEFAEITAGVFAKFKVNVFLFPKLAPTPLLSFAVRELKSVGGVVITASHNPPEYNGFKAYLADGGQLVPPDDSNIITSIEKISDWSEIPILKTNSTEYKKHVKSIDKKVFESYISKVLKTEIFNKTLKPKDRDYSIVYSPLHGTGGEYMKALLNKAGYKKVYLVPAQEKPNGEFPTVKFPNPEEKEALVESEKFSKQKNAKVFVATDPDADRMGIGILNSKGEYELLNGNQIGSIMCAYLAEKINSKPRKFDYFIFKTIVTTELQEKISKLNKIKLKDLLTGFKYIGAEMTKLEKDKNKKFLFGGEESYGYLPIDLLRDKDSLSSTLLFLEILSEKKDILAYLNQIFLKYGLYLESLKSITLKGESGKQKIKDSLENLRKNADSILTKKIGQRKVIGFLDFKNKIAKGTASKSVFNGLPNSDVIQLLLEDSGKLTIRPSGTEPKIKLYSSFQSKIKPKNESEIFELKKILEEELKNSEKEFMNLADLNG